MATLVLPRSVKEQRIREQVDSHIGKAHEFHRQLQELSEELSLAWVQEDAEEPGLIPGRWHVVQEKPGCAAAYIPIIAEDGGYMDPHSGIIEELRKTNLQSKYAWERLENDFERKQNKIKKARQERNKELASEMADRIAAKTRPSILFSDIKWRNKQ